MAGLCLTPFEWFVVRMLFNLLTPEFDIYILAHPVCKMLITQEPKKLALQNTQHFEEKRRRHCTLFKKN
jgi:hypothetical protein